MKYGTALGNLEELFATPPVDSLVIQDTKDNSVGSGLQKLLGVTAHDVELVVAVLETAGSGSKQYHDWYANRLAHSSKCIERRRKPTQFETT